MDRKWTKQEIEYLEEKWGSKPMEGIAKELGRKIGGVQAKAHKLGLGRFTRAGDYITIYELAEVVNQRRLDGHTMRTWRRQDMPIRRKKVKTMMHNVIAIEDFWEWASTHREILDFSKIEENVLGIEPEWVKTKRKWDVEKARLNTKWEWTKAEDEKLKRLIERGMSANEIAIELRRTVGAVYTRKRKLGLEMNRQRSERCIFSEEEQETIKRLIEESCSYIVMSHQIGKGEKAIRGFVGRTYGTEDLDKIRTNKRQKRETE